MTMMVFKWRKWYQVRTRFRDSIQVPLKSSGTTMQHPSLGTASKRKQSALKFASLPPRPKEKSVITMLRKKTLKKWLRKVILRMDLHKPVWREGSGPRKKEMKSICMWPISSMRVEYHWMLSMQGALRLCVRPFDSMDLDINLLATMRWGCHCLQRLWNRPTNWRRSMRLLGSNMAVHSCQMGGHIGEAVTSLIS